MKAVTYIFIAMWLILTTGCQYDPYAGEMTTEQPKVKDVIGAYQFKEQNISQVHINKRGEKATIVLNADGTYQANNIPNVFDLPDTATCTYISAKGKWKISEIGGVERWSGLKPEWGITLTSIDKNLENIGFTGEKAPYGLMVTFGDPDEGTVMRFEKVK